MELFKRKSKKKYISAIKDILLHLEDSMGNNDIMAYIKNSVEVLIANQNVKLNIEADSFTVATSNIELTIKVNNTFTDFNTIETTEISKHSQGYNTTFKKLTIKEGYKETTENFTRELRANNTCSIKKDSEKRAYINDSLIYRSSKKHEQIVNTTKYHSSTITYNYFISGEKAIKSQESIEMSGHFQKNEPVEDSTNTETQYFHIPHIDQRYFISSICLLEPSGYKINATEFKNRLKSFQNAITRENAPKEFLNQIKNTNINKP